MSAVWITVSVVVVLALAGGGIFVYLRDFKKPTQTNSASGGPASQSAGPSANASTATAVPGPDSTGTATPAPTQTGTPGQFALDGIVVSYAPVMSNPAGAEVAVMLAGYFGGIDIGHYRQAWSLYAPNEQSSFPYSGWVKQVRSSRDVRVVVQSLSGVASGNVVALVTFRSHQAPQYGPNPGETCTDWSLNYHLVPNPGYAGGPTPSSSGASYPAASAYLISKVTLAGTGHIAC